MTPGIPRSDPSVSDTPERILEMPFEIASGTRIVSRTISAFEVVEDSVNVCLIGAEGANPSRAIDANPTGFEEAVAAKYTRCHHDVLCVFSLNCGALASLLDVSGDEEFSGENSAAKCTMVAMAHGEEQPSEVTLLLSVQTDAQSVKIALQLG